MTTVILIAFQYTYNVLPGAIIDLYHAYMWSKTVADNIHIITDITSIQYPKYIQEAIQQNIVDEDIHNFYPCDNMHMVHTIDDILSAIHSIPWNDKLIIYYSGHGLHDAMVLPDRSTLPFIDFRNAITKKTYTEIFMILDCCNPGGLGLPFQLIDNTFRLVNNTIHFVSEPIILITSANVNEKSAATHHGSLFSRYVFRLLTDMKVCITSTKIPNTANRNLQRLMGNLSSNIRTHHSGYNQTVSIYSSYMMDPVLWLWISNYSDIVGDMSQSMLVVRR